MIKQVQDDKIYQEEEEDDDQPSFINIIIETIIKIWKYIMLINNTDCDGKQKNINVNEWTLTYGLIYNKTNVKNCELLYNSIYKTCEILLAQLMEKYFSPLLITPQQMTETIILEKMYFESFQNLNIFIKKLDCLCTHLITVKNTISKRFLSFKSSLIYLWYKQFFNKFQPYYEYYFEYFIDNSCKAIVANNNSEKEYYETFKYKFLNIISMYVLHMEKLLVLIKQHINEEEESQNIKYDFVKIFFENFATTVKRCFEINFVNIFLQEKKEEEDDLNKLEIINNNVMLVDRYLKLINEIAKYLDTDILKNSIPNNYGGGSINKNNKLNKYIMIKTINSTIMWSNGLDFIHNKHMSILKEERATYNTFAIFYNYVKTFVNDINNFVITDNLDFFEHVFKLNLRQNWFSVNKIIFSIFKYYNIEMDCLEKVFDEYVKHMFYKHCSLGKEKSNTIITTTLNTFLNKKRKKISSSSSLSFVTTRLENIISTHSFIENIINDSFGNKIKFKQILEKYLKHAIVENQQENIVTVVKIIEKYFKEKGGEEEEEEKLKTKINKLLSIIQILNNDDNNSLEIFEKLLNNMFSNLLLVYYCKYDDYYYNSENIVDDKQKLLHETKIEKKINYFITIYKVAFGSSIVYKMENMMNDIKTSKQLNKEFSNASYCLTNNHNILQVKILKTNIWPTSITKNVYSIIDNSFISLSSIVNNNFLQSNYLQSFEKWYCEKFPSRKLYWNFSMDNLILIYKNVFNNNNSNNLQQHYKQQNNVKIKCSPIQATVIILINEFNNNQTSVNNGLYFYELVDYLLQRQPSLKLSIEFLEQEVCKLIEYSNPILKKIITVNCETIDFANNNNTIYNNKITLNEDFFSKFDNNCNDTVVNIVDFTHTYHHSQNNNKKKILTSTSPLPTTTTKNNNQYQENIEINMLIDTTIMKLLKSRKQLDFKSLKENVDLYLKKKMKEKIYTTKQFKLRLDNLIEKDYIYRNENDIQVYCYNY